MKRVCILLSFLLFVPDSFAQVIIEPYTKQTIRESSPFMVRLLISELETDGCNTYGLSGSFRKVADAKKPNRRVLDLLADFAVTKTNKACPRNTPRKIITLGTDWYPITNHTIVNVYAPEIFEVEYQVEE